MKCYCNEKENAEFIQYVKIKFANNMTWMVSDDVKCQIVDLSMQTVMYWREIMTNWDE